MKKPVKKTYNIKEKNVIKLNNFYNKIIKKANIKDNEYNKNK